MHNHSQLPSQPQTWLITGASSGLGLALALAALHAGQRVIGTARNVSKTLHAMENGDEDLVGLLPYLSQLDHPFPSSLANTGDALMEPKRQSGDRQRARRDVVGMFSWRQLDVTQPDVGEVVRDIVEKEDVDVLVCNAGVGIYGALEDMSEQEIRGQMETNFFGTTLCLHASLPHFRHPKTHITTTTTTTTTTTSNPLAPPPRTLITMSSISGLLVSSASGLMYSASKFAIEAVSEGLALQMSPFNLRVLIVEPGLFRTNWLKGSYSTPARGTSEAYREGSVGTMLERYPGLHGRQEGDPWKAGERVVDVVMGRGMAEGLDERLGGRMWPVVGGCLRLPLGGDAVEKWEDRMGMLGRNLEVVREMALSTTCDDVSC